MQHCRARVAQGIRDVPTYRRLYLPPAYAGSLYSVLLRSNYTHRSRLLPDLTGHLTTQADDGHASPLSVLGKPFRLTFILLSLLVRFTVYYLIKPHASPFVAPPRQFL